MEYACTLFHERLTFQEMIYYGWRMFLGSGGFFRVALAINRKDVKPMSQQFRDFFIEYLKDVNENYAKAVELVQMDEDKLMEAMIEKAGLSSIDLLALDEDVQGQVSERYDLVQNPQTQFCTIKILSKILKRKLYFQSQT